MDSINLSETQSTPLNFRSTGSNTSPVQCDNCNLDEFAQVFPQSCFVRAPSHGQSRCKHPQDGKENFPMQQFFPSIPFLPPFFYNGALGGYLYPPNPATDTLTKEKQRHSANEPENVPRTGHFFCSNNQTLGEDAQKNMFWPPFIFPNGPEAQFNSFFQRCGCGDSFPWSCGSFVVPMISYCVIWNSRNNLPGSCAEMVCRQNKQCEKDSDTNKEAQDGLMKELNNNSTTPKSFEHLLMTSEWEKEKKLAEEVDQNTAKSSLCTLLTVSSMAKDNIDQAEKTNTESGSERCCAAEDEEDEEVEEVEEEAEEDEEEEEGEEDGTDSGSEYQEKNYEDMVADEKDFSSCGTFQNQPQDCQKENKSKKKGTLDTEIFFLNEAKSETSAEGENIRPTKTNLTIQEKYKRHEKASTSASTHFKKAISIKKSINNFTITDQTKCVHDGEQNVAAAGDLGGINCTGYKVSLQEPFEEGIIDQGTETEENLQSKGCFVKGVSREDESCSPKIPEKYQKTGRNLKSGIAKLMINTKLTDIKKDTVKPMKANAKESTQEEHYPVKRKHSCFPTDGRQDSNVKIQKLRTSGAVQQQIQVLERPQRMTQVKTEKPKKKEIKEKPVKGAGKK